MAEGKKRSENTTGVLRLKKKNVENVKRNHEGGRNRAG